MSSNEKSLLNAIVARMHRMLFRRRKSNRNLSVHSFIKFISDNLCTDDRICQSTMKNIERTICLLITFNETDKSKILTHEYLDRFVSWMKARGYNANTIAKHLSILKTYYNKVVRSGIECDAFLFNNYRIRTQQSNYSFLTPEELCLLENYTYILTEMHGNLNKTTHCMNAFLFCCYTGLRFSDFINLDASNLSEEASGKWLDYTSVKTKVHVRVPLNMTFNGKALKILEKYGFSQEFYELPPNPTVNRHISTAAAAAGLKKHISFHTARHTNATLLVYHGLALTTVQKLLGHKNLKTTSSYCDIMDQTLLSELGKASF